MKIVLVPLDDRPCNLYFPKILPLGDNKIVITPDSIMGNIKEKANILELKNWIKKEIKDADYLVLALDTLIYGGLIPSRLHHSAKEELLDNLNFVKELKEDNNKLKIYSFLTIMRTPNSNFDSEEPDYYSTYGKMIFRLGQLIHKKMINVITEDELNEYKNLKKEIPQEIIDDYTNRRQINLAITYEAYRLYEQDYFDYFYLPQDDSNPYGFTRIDQMKIHELMLKGNKKVQNFPGADEVGMVMVSRCINDYYHKKPKVFVYYASSKGQYVIPTFEDRPIDTTINEQITASGGFRVHSITECDFILAINIGGDMLYFPNEEERIIPYDIERNLADFVSFIKYAKELGKNVGVCDVAIPTGADMELLKLFQTENMLLSIDSYASWNTASNTIGTVLSNLSIYEITKDKTNNFKFLIHRYYDDVGYCSYARTWTDINAALARGYTEAKLDGRDGSVTKMTRVELMRYMNEEFPEISQHVSGIYVTSPWNRTFEMQFDIAYK